MSVCGFCKLARPTSQHFGFHVCADCLEFYRWHWRF